jgi:RND family efflux transporter MFP subunit
MLAVPPAVAALRRRALLAIVGLAACHALAIPGEALAQAAPSPVTVANPLQRDIVEYTEFTGQFAAVDYIEVRSRVSGYLQEIRFEDGQLVRQGDVLFVIDPRPFEAALASARAELAQAQARIELANQQLERAGELRQRGNVATSVYDERLEEQRVAVASAEIARATIRTADLNLEFTRIVAPIDGRISRHEVSVGNLVSGGAGSGNTLLTTIVSTDPIHFVFDMSESAFLAHQRAVQTGRLQTTRSAIEVFARLTDEPDWPRVGALDFVDNRVDRTSGTIRVRARFPNTDGFLTPGQFGRIRLPGSDLYTALLIPDEAIVTDQSNKIVMTVADDGTVVPKPVRPGPIYDGLRVVRNGLEAGDRIIINGLMRARPGARVTPQQGEIRGAGEKRPG